MKKTEKEKFKNCYKKVDGGYEIIKAYTFKLGFDFPDIECDKCEILGNHLTLFPSFFWNGATMFPDLRSILRGSAGHDGLFELLKKLKTMDKPWKKYLKPSNKELSNWCKEDGMNWLCAQAVYRTTNIFGKHFI